MHSKIHMKSKHDTVQNIKNIFHQWDNMICFNSMLMKRIFFLLFDDSFQVPDLICLSWIETFFFVIRNKWKKNIFSLMLHTSLELIIVNLQYEHINEIIIYKEQTGALIWGKHSHGKNPKENSFSFYKLKNLQEISELKDSQTTLPSKLQSMKLNKCNVSILKMLVKVKKFNSSWPKINFYKPS